MTLVILDSGADPVLTLAATGPADQPLVAQVFSGWCHLGDQPEEKTRAKFSAGRGPFLLGLYLPGAGPYRPSHLLTAWAEMSLGMTEIAGGDYAQRGPYGVNGVHVQLVDDGRGSGSQWPYLAFRACGGEPMVVRYRVTVTRPTD